MSEETEDSAAATTTASQQPGKRKAAMVTPSPTHRQGSDVLSQDEDEDTPGWRLDPIDSFRWCQLGPWRHWALSFFWSQL